MSYDIKPIETHYAGYRFRSRLEARWAVFFDALNIRWEYESEGYDLGKHGYYLPDFYLPGIGLWGCDGTFIEIKPNDFDDSAIEKALALAFMFGGKRGVAICPGIPGDKQQWLFQVYPNEGVLSFTTRLMLLDGTLCFLPYEKIKPDFTKSSFGYGEFTADDVFAATGDGIKKLEAAFDKARQARFEHGQTPSVRHSGGRQWALK